MLYAKVVVGLAIEGPFDYIVFPNLVKKIKVGARVRVSFRTQKLIGYVVALTRKTKIKSLKSILELIDDSPVLDRNMLLLTKKLSDYYCCSSGEAIETALPEALRKGKKLPGIAEYKGNKQENNPEVTLIHDLDGKARWDIYFKLIKKTITNNKSVIILLPDIDAVLAAKEKITARIDMPIGILYRKQPKELEEWCNIKKGGVKIVVGTRSGIFAPVDDLGLVIIDEEQNAAYKQDQVPHYHAREVALMRINIEKAKLVLGSSSPTLESLYLVKKNKIKYMLIPQNRDFPEIKITDSGRRLHNLKQKSVLSKYLQDSIAASLAAKEKILLFLNRRGFATYVSCSNCANVLKCPRCSINLVYHFRDNILSCHYCNFKLEPPNICPNCNSGYIRYLGTGAEKIESELSRLFPQARINLLDKEKHTVIADSDISVSTESIIKEGHCDFNLIGVLSIDNSLNRIDFRSSEKTFALLVGLSHLTTKKIVIQTALPRHYCIRAIENKDITIFYEEELKQRRQLDFPPYKHIGLVKLRGNNEDKVEEASNRLFEELKKAKKSKAIEIISVNPGAPAKLRGKFCWQILIKTAAVQKLSNFLKNYLKDFLHSGIIVTVDIDPL
jgi:primosomal protein N' (replication factor Y)